MPIPVDNDNSNLRLQLHPQKRRKIHDIPEPTRIKRKAKSIFVPYRTVGLVSPSSVPFTSIALGKKTFQITTCLKDCLQTYDLQRGLQLVFLTRPRTPGDICASATWKTQVLAAWSRPETREAGVWIFQRGIKIGELEQTDEPLGTIQSLCVFGAWIIGVTATAVHVWKQSNHEFYTSIFSERSAASSEVFTGAICHIPTILDKIFVGRYDGSVDILNVRTSKLIYKILPVIADAGPITALEPAPSHALLTIAYSNGYIVIQNVYTDMSILQINAGSNPGPVISISFRTDGMGAGSDGSFAGVMATANRYDGDVTIWDLNEGGHIAGVLRQAHRASTQRSVRGGVSRVQFLHGQSVLITSGCDNSLKSWIFDTVPFSPLPRLLHGRGGHADSITSIKFLPADTEGSSIDGKWLMTGSLDRTLWAWSLRRDGQSSEISQVLKKKNQAKKKGLMIARSLHGDDRSRADTSRAPPITCIAVSMNRDGGIGSAPGVKTVWDNNAARVKGSGDATVTGSTGWESVVTGHENDKNARTWFWGRKRAGRWTLPTGDDGYVHCVDISPCGTFALVGSSGGAIDSYNLQSGRHRQHFPQKIAHKKAMKVTSQTDVSMQLHDPRFKPGTGRHRGAVTGLAVDGMNRVMCSSGSDGLLKFWHFRTGHLFHEMSWSTCRSILHLRYHKPSDLLALSCDDLSIRVVDIETKRMVRAFRDLNSPAGDLCFSPDGRWIVAASGQIVRVWDVPTGHLIDAMRLPKPCTSLAFSPTGEFLATIEQGNIGINIWNNRSLYSHISTKQIAEDDIIDVDLDRFERCNQIADTSEDTPDVEVVSGLPSVDQLSNQIETLSMLPKARWQTLLHLDLIQERNKPKEPPKAPEKAPFFLGSIQSSRPEEGEDLHHATKEQSRIMRMDRAEGKFSKLIRQSIDHELYDPMFLYLKNLAPAAADLEIRSLNDSELSPFVQALTMRLKQKIDFELVQAWMNVLLRLHGDQLDPEILRVWQQEQQKEMARLAALAGYSSGVVGFLRSGRS